MTDRLRPMTGAVRPSRDRMQGSEEGRTRTKGTMPAASRTAERVKDATRGMNGLESAKKDRVGGMKCVNIESNAAMPAMNDTLRASNRTLRCADIRIRVISRVDVTSDGDRDEIVECGDDYRLIGAHPREPGWRISSAAPPRRRSC
jgi:hypothetical protein